MPVRERRLPALPFLTPTEPLSSAPERAQGTRPARAGGPETAKGPDAARAVGRFACGRGCEGLTPHWPAAGGVALVLHGYSVASLFTSVKDSHGLPLGYSCASMICVCRSTPRPPVPHVFPPQTCSGFAFRWQCPVRARAGHQPWTCSRPVRCHHGTPLCFRVLEWKGLRWIAAWTQVSLCGVAIFNEPVLKELYLV